MVRDTLVIEVTFHDAKQHLGFEQPQGWTRQAAQRTAPVAMRLYSLIVWWFAKTGHRLHRPPHRPWYPKKPHASFADILATLRSYSARREVLSIGLSSRGIEKPSKSSCTSISRPHKGERRTKKTDKLEFYAAMDLDDPALADRLAEWQRPHGAQNGKTPRQKASELSGYTPF